MSTRGYEPLLVCRRRVAVTLTAPEVTATTARGSPLSKTVDFVNLAGPQYAAMSAKRGVEGLCAGKGTQNAWKGAGDIDA